VKGLARFEAYDSQAATSEVDRRCLSGKTAADDNSIGIEFRFVVPRLSFHKALELPGARGRRRLLHAQPYIDMRERNIHQKVEITELSRGVAG